MPLFMIESNSVAKLTVTPEGAAAINKFNKETSVCSLTSFLSADSKKTYCHYEAASPEAICEAARRGGIPAEVIIEVDEEIVPNGATNDL